MFQQKLSFSSLIGAALFAVSLSWGAPTKAREGQDMGKLVAYLEKELALTPTQSAQVREVLKPDSLLGLPHLALADGLLIADELLDQLRSPSVDTAAMSRLFERLDVKQRELYVRAQVRFMMLHSALTMEQRHKLADILQKRLDRVEARKEKKDAPKK